MAHRGRRQSHGRLWRVLQVAIHDKDPVAPGDPGAGRDRAAETAPTLAGGPVHQTDGYSAPGTQLPHDIRSVVVAVIHDQDLSIDAVQCECEPLKECADVVRFVAGRNQHSKLLCQLRRLHLGADLLPLPAPALIVKGVRIIYEK
jgi:hypothetical protein